MENLKIKQKHEDMIKYGYIALRQFPKSEKFSLAQDIADELCDEEVNLGKGRAVIAVIVH